jgi:hypothetical protein
MYYRILATVSTVCLVIIATFCVWIASNVMLFVHELKSSKLPSSTTTNEASPLPFIPDVRHDSGFDAKDAARKELRDGLAAPPIVTRPNLPRITPVPSPSPTVPKPNPKEIFPGFERR